MSGRRGEGRNGADPRGFVKADDVARMAGVSRSAVSRTFTPGASVSDAVRLRVEAAAKALGYRVNRLAQGLTSEETNLVGLVGANLAAPFMAALLDRLSRQLLGAGYQCLLLNASDGADDVAPLIELMLEYRVRAIVVLSGSPPAAIVNECARSGVRLVLINREAPNETSVTIDADDERGGTLAAERLIAAGTRHAAFVASGARTTAQRRRAASFTAAMHRAGIPVTQWWEGETSYENGLAAAMALLGGRREGAIDGVFCVTDLIALGFLDGVRHRLGLQVPDDVSVVGYDDIPLAAWESYGLTTVAQDCAKAAEAVLAALSQPPSAEHRNIRYPVTLVERRTAR